MDSTRIGIIVVVLVIVVAALWYLWGGGVGTDSVTATEPAAETAEPATDGTTTGN